MASDLRLEESINLKPLSAPATPLAGEGCAKVEFRKEKKIGRTAKVSNP